MALGDPGPEYPISLRLSIKRNKMTNEDAFRLVRKVWEDLGAIQSGKELQEFVLFISQNDISHILELGTCGGGSLLAMHRAAKPGIRISMDLEWEKREPAIPEYRHQQFLDFIPGVVEILGQIHDAEQQRRVEDFLDGRKLDLMFIDADHSYEGGEMHWIMYRQFIRPGGFVCWHDVRNGWSVGKFYDELCAKGFPNWTFVDPNATFGIGCLQLP